MRVLEPWAERPLVEFLQESSARLVLLMTSAGQVIAQHGFTRSLDVMAAAALGAAIVSSTGELARVMGTKSLGHVVHQGTSQGMLLSPLTFRGSHWIVLAVYGRETTLGLVQVFLQRMADQLREAAPGARAEAKVLAEQFEDELNRSLRRLFGR